jgi:hypothetical protein
MGFRAGSPFSESRYAGYQMVGTLYFHCADVKGSTDVKYGQQLVGEPRGCITNNVVLFVSI